jgi:glycosyltransferase involved in cell wall biosynthesis
VPDDDTMHICFLSRGSFPHLPAYVEFFRRRGHHVSLIHLDPHPLEGAENHSAAAGSFDPVRGKWKLPFHLPRVLWHVWRLQPDILHAHYATSAGFLGALTGFQPLVVTCHGSDVLLSGSDPFRRPALKLAFARARVVHVVSNHLRELAISMGADAGKIVVSNVGVVPQSLASPRATREREPVEILWTRRLEEIYDPMTLLRGLAIFAERGGDFRCTIAGGGSLLGDLRALAAGLGLADRVRFVGGFNAAELPALLRASDVYVTCAVSDGASLSLLEGMAGGLFPVVADIPANREWIIPGDNGLLFQAGNADGLAQALEVACRVRDRWPMVAERNRGLVNARGDRDRNLLQMEEIYKRLRNTE